MKESFLLTQSARNLVARLRRPAGGASADDGNAGFALHGFEANRIESNYVEFLTDAELAELNSLLRWHCFTADSRGRRFGRRSSPTKRVSPQAIPDPRVVELDRRFGLNAKRVLEIGCFEGIHTISLARFGAAVTAIDSRIENVVKTIVRAAMFGVQAQVFKCDVEVDADLARLPEVDLLHHVGVLYHLADPVTHLMRLLPLVGEGVLLDTHYAAESEASERYEVGGRLFRYSRYREGGVADVFSGMSDHARWLHLDDLHVLLREAGFTAIDIADQREERNGSRVTLFAHRT